MSPKKSTKKKKPKKTKISTKTSKKKGKGSRKGRYFYAVGRRKRAVAQVKLVVGAGKIKINGRDYKDYFSTYFLRKIVHDAPICIGRPEGFDLEIKVEGGGLRGQAEAVRHGITRALVLFEPNFRKKLKKAGFLMRDPRKKERKKYGLKGARRAPQWSKR